MQPPIDNIDGQILSVAKMIHWTTKESHASRATILPVKQNLALRLASAIEAATSIMYGVCVAFLGVMGVATYV